uniref:ATP synthase F0 subunit 8 n=1 Tax=Xanthodes albago TaxID=753447 RepID=UPI002079D1C1|nr:ATP synthase F0 subunit 8 [Xanthodes albago]URW97497.1 ATP synthase F0 subunit 8 [Xanthodes albago]
MPQMMPINWLISFFFFLFIFLIFNIMNYYIYNNKISNKNENLNFKMKNLYWKW